MRFRIIPEAGEFANLLGSGGEGSAKRYLSGLNSQRVITLPVVVSRIFKARERVAIWVLGHTFDRF